MKTPSSYRYLFAILLMYPFTAYTQDLNIDSLEKVLSTQKVDTNKVKLLLDISWFYIGTSPDTSIIYAQEALTVAEKINYERGILYAQLALSYALTTSGNYPLAMDFGFKALALAKRVGREPLDLILPNSSLATCYYYLGDFDTSLKYGRDASKIVIANYPDSLAFIYTEMSRIFEAMNESDSALLYAKKSYEQIKSWHFENLYTLIYPVLGNAYAGKGKYDSALSYYRMGIPVTIKNKNTSDEIDIYNGIANVYKSTGDLDSALLYSKMVLTDKIKKSYPTGLLKASTILASIYESKNKPDSALKYLRIALDIKDGLFNREKIIAVQNLAYKEQEKQKEIEATRIKLQNQFMIPFLVAAFIGLLTITAIVLRNRRRKQLQNMRNSIADDLHDDIGSQLSSISIMNDMAKAGSPEAISLRSSIGESTAIIQENMNDIVWAIKSENDSLENILQHMNQFASEILDAKNIELDFTTDVPPSSSRLRMGHRKNFYLFFKEAINNAAKYSNARKVSVCIAKKGHYIEMDIQDDGKGFDTDKVLNGNGMGTLKKRAEELKADFKIISNINEGTAVHLKFKIT